ncbi:MAG: DUF1549 and DUF1553 domain-containing protein, partial [Verrucomicrobiales bacterium]
PIPGNIPWSKNPIDRFVASQQEARGIKPNPEADPRKLARRLYFDLTGLPPTAQEVEAFVRAWEPAAADNEVLDATVDRLLASPRFGEKWARHWLDVARFAESHGFEQDYDRPYAYHYRDFVIRALNDDMPYDQFVKWQLAGDEFAPDDPLALMATGFLGAGVFPTQLTEKEFESARYDELHDMAATTGTAFLGLTIGCARCHDHKYDPIPVRDYYRLLSSFTTTIRSEIELDLEPETYLREKKLWEEKRAKLARARDRFEEGDIRHRFQTWLTSASPQDLPDAPWQVLDTTSAKSGEGTTFSKLPDGSLLASGENPNLERYYLGARLHTRNMVALRIEALAHPSMRKNGPGRARNGNFQLSDLKVFIRPLDGKKGQEVQVKLVSARATHEQNEGALSAKASFDENTGTTGWAVDKGGIGNDQAAVFEFERPIGFEGGTMMRVQMNFAGNVQHSMGRVRLSVSAGETPVVVGGGAPQTLLEAVQALASRGPDQLPQAQREALLRWFAQRDPQWAKLEQALSDYLLLEPRPRLTVVQVCSEGLPPTKHHADARGFPHFYPKTYFLTRGDVLQKGQEATQGFLQVLLRKGETADSWQEEVPEGWRTSYRRRALANWMTDPGKGAGHLLARVVVNRLWHQYFGRGLVATPSDFGYQGTRPTHPQLLDYLARELIDNGWRLKPIHKMLLHSATYRQSSTPNPAMEKIDPENLYLWRFSPRRLQAENIRDSLLALSGVLDETMFGPGSLDAGNARRSIYLMIKRSQLVPMMQVFDAPEPLVSQGSRPATTIAPQALIFMNNENVRRWVDVFAGRLDQVAADSLEAAVRLGYLEALGRAPKPDEMAGVLTFIRDQAASYSETGEYSPRRLALGDFAQILISLNEFVYLE